ncbi:P pilus assembly chaperone PapD [Streptosporangium album]|uniref:P pilus assembly chaperone PapD n=1 Tax=Streptosporangium album TaxID=47479 RepID=A0A7W7S7H1_9ACTN|nr:hypothetical protein [Streptosporangium album]MBB4944261.1 P pilus assembly chaperone PapD [Streptosporangium album]
MSTAWLLTTSNPAALALTVPPPPTPAAPEFSLKVSPTRLVMSPHQSISTQHFQVVNTGRITADVDVTATSLEQHPDGSLTYPPTAPYSAAHWVSMTPRHFRLDPGAVRQVRVRLTMPAQPEPGEHYVALLSLVPSQEQHEHVQINRGVAVPLLVTVPGSAVDSVTLTELGTSGFSAGGPITLTAVVKDTGTVHHDFFGPDHNLVAEADGRKIAFPDFTVLRGSTRTVTTQWADPPLACICHIKVAIPQKGLPPHVLEATVVRFPLYPVGGLTAAIAALFFMWRFMASRFTLQRREPQLPT